MTAAELRRGGSAAFLRKQKEAAGSRSCGAGVAESVKV